MDTHLLSSVPSSTICFSIHYLSLEILTIFLGVLRLLQTNKYYYAALVPIGITEGKRKERNIDFHSLRHFFNLMLCVQIDDSNLFFIVGHQSKRMSDNYTHEVRERLLQIGKVSSNIIAFPKSS